MQRIGSLDFLRALAVISVFIYHLFEIGKVALPLPSLVRIGWIGVDLFFVLSGFFIALTILKSSEWKPFVFAKRRLFRIVPAYYVSILIVVVFLSPAFLTSTNGFIHIASHLTFIHSWFLSTHGSINGVYWTLGVEMFFYLIMAISAPLLRGRHNRFWLLMGVWFTVTYLWRAYIYFNFPEDGMLRFVWATMLFGMLDEFGMGVIVAFIYLKTDWLKSFVGYKWFILFLVTQFVIISSIYYLLRHTGDYWFHFQTITFWRTWLALGFSLAIVLLITSRMQWLNTFFRYSLLSYTGKISYSIYLYHIPVVLSVTSAAKMAGLSNGNVILLSVVVTWLVAALSYHLIESRFHLK